MRRQNDHVALEFYFLQNESKKNKAKNVGTRLRSRHFSLYFSCFRFVKNRILMQRGHAVDAWKRMRRSTQRGLDVITRRRGRKVLHELLQLVKTLQGCPVEPPNELVHPEAEPYGPDQESVGPGGGLGAPRAAEPGGALHAPDLLRHTGHVELGQAQRGVLQLFQDGGVPRHAVLLESLLVSVDCDHKLLDPLMDLLEVRLDPGALGLACVRAGTWAVGG